MESREMKQVFDLDTLAILWLGALTFIASIDPMVKLGFLAIGILTLILKIIKDREGRKIARAEHEQSKAKRAEEHAEHELRMKLLEKDLEEKSDKTQKNN